MEAVQWHLVHTYRINKQTETTTDFFMETPTDTDRPWKMSHRNNTKYRCFLTVIYRHFSLTSRLMFSSKHSADEPAVQYFTTAVASVWRKNAPCVFHFGVLTVYWSDTVICRTASLFSEHELMFTFAICRRPSVRLSSVCLSVCLSVTFVHPTQPNEIFGNVSA